jgi:hypothetical protein
MIFLHSLAAALLLTILTEYAVYLLIVRRNPLQLLLYSVLINSFTNPLFNYLYNYRLHELYPLEMAATLVETILIVFLMEVSFPKALLISLTANLASLLVGLLIFG